MPPTEGPDTVGRKPAFDQLGSGLYAYSAGGDPNSGVIIGDDGVIVIDAQPPPHSPQRCRSTWRAPMTRRAARRAGDLDHRARPRNQRGAVELTVKEALAPADDGDDRALSATAGRRIGVGNGAGDLVAADLAERIRLGVGVRLAVGVGGKRAAFFLIGEAAIDAVIVGVVGDDEHAPLGARCAGKAQHHGKTGYKTGEECTHEIPSCPSALFPRRSVQDFGQKPLKAA